MSDPMFPRPQSPHEERIEYREAHRDLDEAIRVARDELSRYTNANTHMALDDMLAELYTVSFELTRALARVMFARLRERAHLS